MEVLHKENHVQFLEIAHPRGGFGLSGRSLLLRAATATCCLWILVTPGPNKVWYINKDERQNHQVGGWCCVSAPKILMLGKFWAWCFWRKSWCQNKGFLEKGSLGRRKRVKRKWRYHLSGRFWKWRKVQGIRELHGKECQGMLRDLMNKAQDL